MVHVSVIRFLIYHYWYSPEIRNKKLKRFIRKYDRYFNGLPFTFVLAAVVELNGGSRIVLASLLSAFLTFNVINNRVHIKETHERVAGAGASAVVTTLTAYSACLGIRRFLGK